MYMQSINCKSNIVSKRFQQSQHHPHFHSICHALTHQGLRLSSQLSWSARKIVQWIIAKKHSSTVVALNSYKWDTITVCYTYKIKKIYISWNNYTSYNFFEGEEVICRDSLLTYHPPGTSHMFGACAQRAHRHGLRRSRCTGTCW